MGIIECLLHTVVYEILYFVPSLSGLLASTGLELENHNLWWASVTLSLLLAIWGLFLHLHSIKTSVQCQLRPVFSCLYLYSQCNQLAYVHFKESRTSFEMSRGLECNLQP